MVGALASYFLTDLMLSVMPSSLSTSTKVAISTGLYTAAAVPIVTYVGKTI